VVRIKDIIHKISILFPHLPTELRMAHMNLRPEELIKKTLKAALTFSLGFSVLCFFLLELFKKPKWYLILLFPLFFFLLFILLMKRPAVKISRRRRDLDREVLFAGRFLLVKIHSGSPLLTALIEASRSYGIASKYFRELVDDINMGTSIEKALDNAMKFSPSLKFKKIIFQISNAIKIGIDVSEPLSNTLDEISHEQFVEIQRYGKKLNSLTIFYMLIAVVMPSIGVAMFAVIGSLIGLNNEIAKMVFYGILGLLLIIQVFFIIIFKSARLTVNL